MIVLPVACVVDASVGTKLELPEPDSPLADALFEHLRRDPRALFYVPGFFFAECASTLRKKVNAGMFSAAEAHMKLAKIMALGLDVLRTRDLADAALDIALTYNISAYDATYVAAAGNLGLPLITADDRLVKKMVSSPYTVLLLATLTIPPPPP